MSIVNKKEDDAVGSKSGEERREESDRARRLGSKEARSSKVKAESEKGGSSRLKGKEARSSRLKASRRGSEKARKLKAESSKLKVAKAVIMKILSVQHHLNPLH